MDSRNLIQSIEENFHQYYHLLNNIETEAIGNSPAETSQLRGLLLTSASIQDEVLEYRLRKILEEEHPYIPQIQVHSLNRKRYDRLSIGQLCDAFLKQRKELVKMLYALPKLDWDRTGLHELEGHITFKELVKRISEKDKETLASLNRLIPAE